ncbi:MAG: TonB C-terminal domain-containing protein [Deltaproteobacteria bacterium]|nr:TonB C-terminal domain-containing protein [Deltaproteobacteria bacterium]
MAKAAKKNFPWIYVAAPLAAVLLVAIVGWFILSLVNFDKRKVPPRMQMVTLVKPPPPPKIEEKPPEEIKEKEIIEEIPPEQTPRKTDSAEDFPKDLGVDAEGTAGGDNFGLLAKKGQALIGGEGDASLLRIYAWYTAILKNEIRDKVKSRLQEEGGMPDGKHRLLIKVLLDSQGNVVDFKIVNPSGNSRIDTALKKILALFRVSEPPPAGMPMTMVLKITAQG